MNNSDSEPTNCLFLDVVGTTHVGFVLAIEISTLVANAVFSLTAVITDAFIAYVICRTPSLQTPSSLFLCCLALSDFITGLVTQPSFVAYKITELIGKTRSVCIGRILHWVTGFTGTGVSVVTIAAISIDRFFALHLHLRYNMIVTKRRVAMVVLFIWLCCASTAISVLFVKSDKYWTFLPLPILLLSLLVTTVCYLQIFRILRRHQRQIQSTERVVSQPTVNNLDFKKYKKSALTMGYIVLLFICSNIPFLVAMVVRVLIGYNSKVKLAYESGCTIMYINSTLNPILYLVRMKDVRRAALTFIGRVFSVTEGAIQRSLQKSASYR